MSEPQDDGVGVVGRERGPDDSRDRGVIERRQVRAGGRERRNARAECRENGFGEIHYGPRVRVRAQEEDRVVETDQCLGIRKGAPAERAQQSRRKARPGPPPLRPLQPFEVVQCRDDPRTSSTAESFGTIVIGRLARAGGGSVYWW